MILPPLVKEVSFTETQRAIQLQLERRNTAAEWDFRGTRLQVAFNELGWVKNSKDYELMETPIIFIGDSFLEVRSSKNLATIVAQLLKAKGIDRNIVTLSKDATGIEQYRHKLYEFAFELNPSHLFLFLYEANDLALSYRYSPYQHPPFYVTNEAIEVVKNEPFFTDVKETLYRLTRKSLAFSSKQEFLEAFEGTELNLTQKNLLYLASYGHSYPPSQFSQTLFPKMFDIVRQMPAKLIDYVRQEKAVSRTRPEAVELYQRYDKVFQRPESERLEAIAKYVCRDYLLLEEHTSCLKLLAQQDQAFISSLISQKDMLYYLLPAVEESLFGNVLVLKERFTQQDIDLAVNNYMDFFYEIQRMLEIKNIPLTVVLIPEASFIDEGFRQFWEDLIDFRRYFSQQHQLYQKLKQELSKTFSVIDLEQYSYRFYNSYWKLDGHWNEKGNREIAQIIASFLVENDNVDQ